MPCLLSFIRHLWTRNKLSRFSDLWLQPKTQWMGCPLPDVCQDIYVTCRGCAVSQQRGCMHELALMFHWACLARHHLRRWQAYTYQQLAKKQRWVSWGYLVNLGCCLWYCIRQLDCHVLSGLCECCAFSYCVCCASAVRAHPTGIETCKHIWHSATMLLGGPFSLEGSLDGLLQLPAAAC